MKKFLYIGSLLVIVFLVIAIICKDNSPSLDVEYVEDLNNEVVKTVKTCVKRQDGKLVLVDVEKTTDESDYLYVLKLYDHYRNALPLTYTSPLLGNFEVLELKKNNNHLDISLNMTYLNGELQPFLTALMWSYQELGITDVDLKINSETFYLSKNEVINESMENSDKYIFEQVVYFPNENEILPITYYHDEDPIHFMMQKILARYPEVTYKLEKFENLTILNINDPRFDLSEKLINAIVYNLGKMKSFKDLVIIKNGVLVYSN